MGPPLFSLPQELFSYTGKNLPLADLMQFWRTSDEIRRKLQIGLAHVKVGRLLLPFCFLFARINV